MTIALLWVLAREERTNLRFMADMDTAARPEIPGPALPAKVGSWAQARLDEALVAWRPSTPANSIAMMQAWAVSRS